MAAAGAWIRKYFVAASVARGWCFRAIIGIIAIVLISNPIHAINQFVLDKVIKVPDRRAIANTVSVSGFIY